MLPIRHMAMACVAGRGFIFRRNRLPARTTSRLYPEHGPNHGFGQRQNPLHCFLTTALVYIYDEPAKKLVWSGTCILKGQAIDVDPLRNQVIANGNIVYDEDVEQWRPESDLFCPVADHRRRRLPCPLRHSRRDINNNPTAITTTAALTVTPSVSSTAKHWRTTCRFGDRAARPECRTSDTTSGVRPAPAVRNWLPCAGPDSSRNKQCAILIDRVNGTGSHEGWPPRSSRKPRK